MNKNNNDYKYLIIGNQGVNKIQIFKFILTSQKVMIENNDLIWESPETKFMAEVKPVIYRGKKSVMSITENGVIIYALTNNKEVLFHKEISGYKTNIHSALPLPDGNVVIADSKGWVGLLLHEGDNVKQNSGDTQWSALTYAHSVVYDHTNKKIYAGGYTSINKYSYHVISGKAKLKLEATYDIKDYYLRCKEYNFCNEDPIWEDGIHDMYQVYGEQSHLFFLSTGERVFLFDLSKLNDLNSDKITLDKFNPFYEIDSKKSREIMPVAKKEKIILKKGGVKSISGNIDEKKFFVIAHSAPWFTDKVSYPYLGNKLIYSTNIKDTIDFDLTDKNKIEFDTSLNMFFYKARLIDENWIDFSC
ncbi:DUF6528 family protein [Xenorhabdus lircayensis]|uniref:Uncharacterized protein n=1 Tax=Xenorhabdus lircayensis TaxID=2763499 RepID=A0ABS0U1L4_9GAMM|nr:DUF6528 family protein [Xenorhabdus lircayensis]MBI6547767.1 hypothetical protein [Xenorhabdus lircayensis]